MCLWNVARPLALLGYLTLFADNTYTHIQGMFCSVDRLSAYLILLSPLQMSPAFTSEYFKNASILAWNKCWIDKLYRVASFSLETLPLQLVTEHFVDTNSVLVSFEKVSRLLLLILTAKIKQYWGISQMCLQHLRLLLAYF